MERSYDERAAQHLEWVFKTLKCKPDVQHEWDSENSTFRLKHQNDVWYLKIGSNLSDEKERIEWLDGKLPVPTIIGFNEEDQSQSLLTEAIAGVHLADLSTSWTPQKIIQKLVAALKVFHAVDISNCPFGSKESNMVLVHGDACLPNFMFDGDKLSGYLDLGDVGISTIETDLAAALWSINHNIGPGYGLRFLQEYGIENATEEMAERLRQEY